MSNDTSSILCRSLAISLLLIGSLVGCGSSTDDQPVLGLVSGVVTLDDKPLPNAMVKFQPESGRPSSGLTDVSGRYELSYLPNVMGAKLGQHSISITMEPTGDADVPTTAEATIAIPAKFNTQSKLKEVVVEGEQTINFDLK